MNTSWIETKWKKLFTNICGRLPNSGYFSYDIIKSGREAERSSKKGESYYG